MELHNIIGLSLIGIIISFGIIVLVSIHRYMKQLNK